MTSIVNSILTNWSTGNWRRPKSPGGYHQLGQFGASYKRLFLQSTWVALRPLRELDKVDDRRRNQQ